MTPMSGLPSPAKESHPMTLLHGAVSLFGCSILAMLYWEWSLGLLAFGLGCAFIPLSFCPIRRAAGRVTRLKSRPGETGGEYDEPHTVYDIQIDGRKFSSRLGGADLATGLGALRPGDRVIVRSDLWGFIDSVEWLERQP